MCKKLFYSILNNKKLDWLKRENIIRLDKIDYYIGLPIIGMMILLFNFGKPFFIPTMIMFVLGGFLGIIRHIKTVPGDIESKLMGPATCFQLFFLVLFSLLLFIHISDVAFN
jgi:hypothetical protein